MKPVSHEKQCSFGYQGILSQFLISKKLQYVFTHSFRILSDLSLVSQCHLTLCNLSPLTASLKQLTMNTPQTQYLPNAFPTLNPTCCWLQYVHVDRCTYLHMLQRCESCDTLSYTELPWIFNCRDLLEPVKPSRTSKSTSNVNRPYGSEISRNSSKSNETPT